MCYSLLPSRQTLLILYVAVIPYIEYFVERRSALLYGFFFFPKEQHVGKAASGSWQWRGESKGYAHSFEVLKLLYAGGKARHTQRSKQYKHASKPPI